MGEGEGAADNNGEREGESFFSFCTVGAAERVDVLVYSIWPTAEEQLQLGPWALSGGAIGQMLQCVTQKLALCQAKKRACNWQRCYIINSLGRPQ